MQFSGRKPPQKATVELLMLFENQPLVAHVKTEFSIARR
jgi:hypothetical protein